MMLQQLNCSHAIALSLVLFDICIPPATPTLSSGRNPLLSWTGHISPLLFSLMSFTANRSQISSPIIDPSSFIYEL
jgi:hypothetical protein